MTGIGWVRMAAGLAYRRKNPRAVDSADASPSFGIAKRTAAFVYNFPASREYYWILDRATNAEEHASIYQNRRPGAVYMSYL